MCPGINKKINMVETLIYYVYVYIDRQIDIIAF